LKVWKAYCTPQARQNRFVKYETVEETFRRDTLMRNKGDFVLSCSLFFTHR
jgi:hypothetical protein